MTVAELIEHLSKYSSDAPVVTNQDAFKFVGPPSLTITGIVVLGIGEWAEELEYAYMNAIDELPESKAYEAWSNEYHTADNKLRADFNSIRPKYPDGFVS